MSHPSSPNNRNSIFGWVKNLKNKNTLSNESLNDLSDTDILSSDYKNSDTDHPSSNRNSFHQEFLRPILNHKSRSTNNVNRVRSNSQSDTAENHSIRQHRDSFLSNNPLVDKNSKYFGVPLQEAVDQACAKISIFTDDNSTSVLQYGKIPVVVAKCGVYLKTNGLNVEGIFRVGGSSKRLKDLQVLFNAPPDFGKKLNWDGYNVHDAASILRRYLNSLPEPLIPLELYEMFRDPLRKRTRIINYMKYKASNPRKVPVSEPAEPSGTVSGPVSEPAEPVSATTDTTGSPATETTGSPATGVPQTPSNSLPSPSLSPDNPDISEIPIDAQLIDDENDADNDDDDNEPKPNDCNTTTNNETVISKQTKKHKHYKKLTRDVHDAINEYKLMLDQIPTLSKQLLFYILDLLAMVQNHSNENLMSSRNLAAIFQPSILSHPNHDLDPTEYALSQFVVEFLIQYAYKLLPNHDGGKLTKPALKTQNRKHSKSLSAHHGEVVGYQNQFTNSKTPVVDNDYDMSDEDSEEDGVKPKNDVVQPAIVVSTPSSSSIVKAK